MLARMKYLVEVVLWWWVGRPTSKMRAEWEAEYAKHPNAPRPGKFYY